MAIPHSHHGLRVAVGFDGSPSAHAALDHAIDLAAPDGKVWIVHAYDEPSDLLGRHEYEAAVASRMHEGQAVLDTTLLTGHDRLADLDYDTELMCADAAAAIDTVARARDVDEIVVGRRGHRRLASALLGSVSEGVLHRADRPVVVVPDPARES